MSLSKGEPVEGRARLPYIGRMAHERIVRDPAVMMGKPTVRGTRITVEQILRKLGAGVPVAEILAAHPRLTPADIQAAQAFAADFLADEEVLLDA